MLAWRGLLSTLLLLAVVVNVGECAVALGLADVSEDYPGHCIDDVTGHPYKVSVTWPMTDMCGQKSCEEHGDKLYITYTTCGLVQVSPECYIEEDLSRPYPDCCPQVVCPPLQSGPGDYSEVSNELTVSLETALPRANTSSIEDQLNYAGGSEDDPLDVFPLTSAPADQEQLWQKLMH